ncbi:hypothetical protein CPB84DRAFT_1853326 [Gymnopilus junonius]|uniref:Uncharacterized protein n=1 Tax=Gymnopilus junonius TaxID=109634 RepID=A0A9P5N9D2_GYMJU|nr:hypothetical protein CPB84DRAFT_1853326 [Gymnopilus junonius]
MLAFGPPLLPSHLSLPSSSSLGQSCADHSLPLLDFSHMQSSGDHKHDTSYYNHYYYSSSPSPSVLLGPVPSTSHQLELHIIPVIDEKSGHEFLEEFILGSHSSGVSATAFTQDLKSLQHSLSLHGITSHGFSVSDCKRNFSDASELSAAAFDMLSRATTDQRSNDNLMDIFHLLDIKTIFLPGHFRRQSQAEYLSIIVVASY